MNRIWRHALFVLACLTGPHAHGDEREGKAAISPDSELGALKFKFEVALDNEAKPVKALERGYRNQLHELRTRHQDEGSLKDVLLVDEELKNPGTVEPRTGDLRRIQSIYLAERKRRQAAYREKEISLYRKYGRACQDLRDSLTRRGNIDAAKLADSEVKRAAEFIRTSQAEEKSRMLPNSPEQLAAWLVGRTIEFHGTSGRHIVVFKRDGAVLRHRNKPARKITYRALSDRDVELNWGAPYKLQYNEDMTKATFVAPAGKYPVTTSAKD